MKGKRKFGVVAGVLAALASMGGCTSQAPIDQIGLHYTGGPIQGKHFDGLINPGSGTKVIGIFDTVAWLPAGQRNYIVSKVANDGDRKAADSIKVPSKGGVLMDFELSVYFKLNTDPKVVRQFYEQVCKKYHCTEAKGWDKMLNDNLRKIIETSMQERIRQYDVGTLYANNDGAAGAETGDVLLRVQTDIGSTLRDRVNSVLGGPFFCGPKFDRAHSDVCPDLEFIINSAVPDDPTTVQSFEAIRRSQNDIETAKNKATELGEQAKGERAKQDALKQAGELSTAQIAYLNAQANLACAQNPNGHCVLVVGSDPNVNVNAG